MAGGRPTIYDASMCEVVIECGRQGMSKVEMCAELDICKRTMQLWEQQHPEFLAALTRAMTLSQAWWETQGRTNLKESVFQSSLYSRSMAARFPDDWRESSKVDVKADITARNKTDLTDDQLTTIATTSSAGTAE